MSELRGYLHEKLGVPSGSDKPSEIELTAAQKAELERELAFVKEVMERAFWEFFNGTFEVVH